MLTRVDGFVRSLEMVKVESWMILRKSPSPRKSFQQIEKEKRQFRTFCVDIFAAHLKGRQHGVANIALHGYCFYNLTQGCFQRSTGIFVNYLDAFQEPKGAFRPTHQQDATK